MKQRFEWIDTLKGIGIASVVASHIYIGPIREFSGIFSMPLFFFISGFLYSPKYSYREYIKKKFVHLIIPYVSFIILLYPIQLLTLLPQRDNFSLLDILKLILNPIIGGTYLWGLTTALWFITCLFITQQVANFLNQKLTRKELMYCLFLMIGLSYLNALGILPIWLPHNAHVTLVSVPMFLIGFFFSKQHENRKYYFLSIPCVIVSLLTIMIGSQQSPLLQWGSIAFDMKRANYGIPVITLLLALGIVLFLIDVSKLLVNKLPFIARIFQILGQASMIILCLHMAFIYALRGLDIQLSYFTIFLLSTILCLISYQIILNFQFTRAFLLGSSSDFERMVFRKKTSRIKS